MEKVKQNVLAIFAQIEKHLSIWWCMPNCLFWITVIAVNVFTLDVSSAYIEHRRMCNYIVCMLWWDREIIISIHNNAPQPSIWYMMSMWCAQYIVAYDRFVIIAFSRIYNFFFVILLSSVLCVAILRGFFSLIEMCTRVNIVFVENNVKTRLNWCK